MPTDKEKKKQEDETNLDKNVMMFNEIEKKEEKIHSRIPSFIHLDERDLVVLEKYF